MTIKEFEKLSDEDKNKMVAEAMGKCWHNIEELPDGYRFCRKCGESSNTILTFENIDYLNTPEGCVAMMEWWLNKYTQFKLYKTKDGILFEYIDYGSTEKMWRIEFACETINTALAIAILKSSGKVED